MSSPAMALDMENGGEEVQVDVDGARLDATGLPESNDRLVVDPNLDPDRFNAVSRAAQALEEPEDFTIKGPPDGSVTLIGGYVAPDGARHTTAEVRELRGRDEEVIARALATGDMTRYIDAIVRTATTRLGEITEPSELAKALDTLLIGDRDLIILQVRRITYGDSMKLDVTCPLCSAEFEISYSFADDVPLKGLSVEGATDPAQRHYDLELPSGVGCTIRLVDGTAQKKVYAPDNLQKTDAELNTLLLTEVLTTLDGKAVRSTGPVLDMKAKDRLFLLNWMLDGQPGPRYQDVKQECPECAREFPIVINMRDMFRGS